ncbi:conserved hypothetical protein [Paraburkholderia tropica]|uniref:DUF1289 domain-containing protein n=1 Tax=Paraburkholderia tropica TaxID=92647 RepID=UPI001CB4570E|nr:DUF1289 domain-containing protein [Paraburkholderia tropica]CAG9219422.1 conserved hypothetical protein [Paraburkholderia tropica]
MSGAAFNSASAMGTPSPCISVCRMHEPSGLCEGCLRTIDEIALWSTFDDAAKRAVWDAIETRHANWIAERFSANRTSDNSDDNSGESSGNIDGKDAP